MNLYSLFLPLLARILENFYKCLRHRMESWITDTLGGESAVLCRKVVHILDVVCTCSGPVWKEISRPKVSTFSGIVGTSKHWENGSTLFLCKKLHVLTVWRLWTELSFIIAHLCAVSMHSCHVIALFLCVLIHRANTLNHLLNEAIANQQHSMRTEVLPRYTLACPWMHRSPTNCNEGAFLVFSLFGLNFEYAPFHL